MSLVLWIQATGLTAAYAWYFWKTLDPIQKNERYHVLGAPAGRFGDFTDHTLVSTLPNPYADPTVPYPPSVYVCIRFLSGSDKINLILLDFICLVALALLLVHVLRPLVAGPWARVSIAFLFLGLSYPVLFCIDRGNIELLLAAFCGWSAFFYCRHRDLEGTVCLFPAICLKLYPAFLLVLLLRRRKAGLALLCGIAAMAAIAASCFLFPVSGGEIWNSYRRNLEFFLDQYVYSNGPLEGAASPWIAYKIVLLALQKIGLIPPVNFGFDGPLILSSYRVYAIGMGLLALVCAGYAWLHEYSPPRSALMLFLFLSISTPSGGDYRLLYASMALVFLVLVARPRRGDRTGLLLLALAVIPKKEILLTFAGKTETTFYDVPLQAFLNPLLILAAMGILLWESRHLFDWRRTAQRSLDLLPWRWRWL